MSATFFFEERLNASGFDWEDDYSDMAWVVGQETFFEVLEGFPRLIASRIPAGVDEVHYVIALSRCKEFVVDKEVLMSVIYGERDGP